MTSGPAPPLPDSSHPCHLSAISCIIRSYEQYPDHREQCSVTGQARTGPRPDGDSEIWNCLSSKINGSFHLVLRNTCAQKVHRAVPVPIQFNKLNFSKCNTRIPFINTRTKVLRETYLYIFLVWAGLSIYQYYVGVNVLTSPVSVAQTASSLKYHFKPLLIFSDHTQ